jgi:hypothetical protein
MNRATALVCLGLLSVSCGEALPDHVVLKPEAENVEIATDAPSDDGYKPLGQVVGQASASTLDDAEQAARIDLRNKAAALGASLVTVDEDTAEPIPLSDKMKVRVTGHAYRPVE